MVFELRCWELIGPQHDGWEASLWSPPSSLLVLGAYSSSSQWTPVLGTHRPSIQPHGDPAMPTSGLALAVASPKPVSQFHWDPALLPIGPRTWLYSPEGQHPWLQDPLVPVTSWPRTRPCPQLGLHQLQDPLDPKASCPGTPQAMQPVMPEPGSAH